MVSRSLQAALLLYFQMLLLSFQHIHCQQSLTTSAGVYSGQVSTQLQLCTAVGEQRELCTRQFITQWCSIQRCIVQPDSCGYGVISPSLFPNGHLATLSSSSPTLAGLRQNGCGACLQITCNDPSPVSKNWISIY